MHEKSAPLMVSPVYLLTSRESVGLRKPHPAQQVGVARVGANPVPERVYCEIEHASRMLFVTLFEQPESFVFVGETRINSRKQIEHDAGNIDIRGRRPSNLLRFDLACVYAGPKVTTSRKPMSFHAQTHIDLSMSEM